MPTRIISFINLKGGVGKTTTTVGLAQILAVNYDKKVLVIDLDPQTNATVMLIGEEKWGVLNRAGLTLATMFKDALEDTSLFDLKKAVQHGVSGVEEVRTVDLLPSSIKLIDHQEQLVNVRPGKFHTVTPTTVLARAIQEILPEYDYILIDCPPNLGYITLNGLYISDAYVIPSIPDVLSTYGIPQIVHRISEFSKDIRRQIEPLGILATKYRRQTALHERTLADLRRQWEDPKRNVRVFETIFPETANMAKAAEYLPFNLLRQKWGTVPTENFDAFAREIMTLMGEKV